MVRSFKQWAAAAIAVVSLGFAGHAAAVTYQLNDQSTQYYGFFTDGSHGGFSFNASDLAGSINTLRGAPVSSFDPSGGFLRTSLNCSGCPDATNVGMASIPASATSGRIEPLSDKWAYAIGTYGSAETTGLNHYAVWYLGGLSGPDGVELADFAFYPRPEPGYGLDLLTITVFEAVPAVPEPSSLLMLPLGLLAVVGARRLRRR
jgi:hypothetical protein